MPALTLMIRDNSSEPYLSNGRSVLIVDDSPLQRKILRSSVARWGFDIIDAESAEEALQICQISLPDIILSDWVMPGMNGLEFCRAFRNLPDENTDILFCLRQKVRRMKLLLDYRRVQMIF
jgi:sigma-B regulation protein RsbU (phosphoserine phosphatase)